MQKNIPLIVGIRHGIWNFILSIHKLEWDKLTANKNNNTFCQCVSVQFKLRENSKALENKKESNKPRRKAEISRISSLILPRPSKKVLEKLKFYKEKDKESDHKTNIQNGQSYTQASLANIKKIIKIKDSFLNLFFKKTNTNKMKKDNHKFNITMKDPSRKQVLMSMSLVNSKKFMVLFCKHVTNINRALKNIKSDIMVDYIRADHRGFVITTNKVTLGLNLNTIEKYIKNVDIINSDKVIALRLPQSKSYLKILGIPYLIKDTNIPIISDVIKKVIQSTYIFNDVVLTSKQKVIKASPKSDMATSSGSKAKSLINRYFNMGSHITTI